MIWRIAATVLVVWSCLGALTVCALAWAKHLVAAAYASRPR